VCFQPDICRSQDSKQAVAYMKKIGKQFDIISSCTWDYAATVAHSTNAKKVAKRRKKLLKTIDKAQKKVNRLPDYKGDVAYRDATVSYLRLTYDVLNNDFAKIVDMAAIAEDSYDAMEAYMKAKELANQKLDVAGAAIDLQQHSFAKAHNINLTESKDKKGKKLQVAGEAFKYHNKCYLIFFKAYKQEAYMLDALSQRDMNALQQNANALSVCVAEGIHKTDTLKAFKADPSLKAMCKEILVFYKTEAAKQVPLLISYPAKKESFDRVKQAYDVKSQSSRTKIEENDMKKAESEFKKQTTEYIKTIIDLNKKRSALLTKWEKALSKFLDKQVPKYK
jgi:hypothetical protein